MRIVCPACKGLDVRRSASRGTTGSLRRLLFPLYRCRTCRRRFSLVSKNLYYLGLTVVCAVFLSILGWMLLDASLGKHTIAPADAQLRSRFLELTKLASADDAGAQYKLARMYRHGDGVVPDSKEEHKWLQRSAEHGNVDAQYELGMILREGKGVVQDYDAGLKWLKLAANRGNAEAQHELGLVYFSGKGVAQDYVEAYIWLNLAAAGGATAAARTRDTVMRLLPASDLAAAQTRARRLSESISTARAP